MDYSWQEKFPKMNKFIPLLLCISFNIKAQIEFSIPETPRQIEYVNVVVNLDSDAQKRVNNHVISLLTPQNSYLESKLELMQWYFPYIEDILEKENVPDDLKYLAVQESNLKPEALSSSAAVGFWQFKEATGKELGLRIDNDIDERKHLDASTEAAARYFKKNNIIFKNWISCIYAYNQGPTGAGKEIPDSWSYASEVTFTKDTPDYLLKALAHRIAYEHRLNRLRKPSTSLLQYPAQGKSLAQIAVELSVDLSELRKYNAWLYSAAIPTSKVYNVLVPVSNERKTEVQNKIDKRLELNNTDKGFPLLVRKTMVTTSDDDPILYTINEKEGILAQPGDEVAQLAKKGNISISYFIKFNDLTDRDMIKTGRVYYLQAKSKKGPTEFHTASKGQTFWDVSQMYNIRLKNLLKFNRLKSPESLQPGRVVWLQKKRPANQPVEIIQEVIQPEERRKIPILASYEQEKVVQKDISPEPIQKVEKPKVLVSKPEVQTELEKVVVKKFEPKPEEPEIIKKTAPAKKPVLATAKMHLVRQGETLYAISKKYGLSVSELRAINNMSKSDVLQYGQNLTVSIGSTSEEPIPSVVTKEPPAKEVVNRTVASDTRRSPATHSVKKGETLFSISQQYEITVNQLKQMNGLSNNTISIGQRLNVGNSASDVLTAKLHSVAKGETLFSISKKYNTSVAQLKAWNDLRSNTITVSQKLKVNK
ncbi:MAG: membrane-bound lytic murein transglycosylase D [Arcticibacterium sp.]|jgi:membrane-bound lytic murein transglycosylase D